MPVSSTGHWCRRAIEIRSTKTEHEAADHLVPLSCGALPASSVGKDSATGYT